MPVPAPVVVEEPKSQQEIEALLRDAAINGKTAEVDRLIKGGVNKEAKDDEVRGRGRSHLRHFKFLWLSGVIVTVESAPAIGC